MQNELVDENDDLNYEELQVKYNSLIEKNPRKISQELIDSLKS